MIENFLRRPRGAGEFTADALRVLGLVSVIGAAIWSTATDAGILSLALPALLVPRFLGVRASYDIVYCVTVLVAAWSNVLDLYRTILGWDLVAHFACTGMIAAVSYIALARFSIVTDPRDPQFRTRTALVLVTVLGLAASAVWEMIEWVGYAFITDEIFVTYQDTIGDMAIGGLGAALASVLIARGRLQRPGA